MSAFTEASYRSLPQAVIDCYLVIHKNDKLTFQ